MDKTLAARKPRLTFAAPFSKPVNGVHDGELVKITHTGDADGMSPVYNIVDKQGQSAWVSQSDVTITDQDFLPLGQEVAESISSASRGLAAAGSSRR